MSVTIDQLAPGTRFRNCVGRVGTLVRLGEGSAVVAYAAGRKEFTAKAYDVEQGAHERHVAFEAPGRPVTISLKTEVEVIE